MILAATAVLAATSIPMQTQTADAGFLRRALFGGHHHHHHGLFRHRSRGFIAAPVLAAPAPVVMRSPGGVRSASSNADGAGRVFDPASMAWSDGKNQCWSGKQPWSFRSGSWFYGSNRWYPANGTWLTDAPQPPTPIDCQSVAAFAQNKAPTTGIARSDKPGRGDTATAENSAQCTRYSSSIGQMISVPCEN
jgi:hypothetical protein